MNLVPDAAEKMHLPLYLGKDAAGDAIVVDLAACEMPYTSPAGRPTMIFTSFRELDRRFGR